MESELLIHEPYGASLTAGVSIRTAAASVKSREPSDELLVALGSKDKQWSVLDEVTVRNLPNGLVSFELVEIFDRFVSAVMTI